MSNRKRNVAFIKPQDPSFLQKMKEQIGFKEGPNVDTKRQKIDNNQEEYSDEEFERDEEKPQIVVLKEGDLTADEVEKLEKEEKGKPADLNQRVIFKAKTKIVDETAINLSVDKNNKKKKSKDQKLKTIKSKLSFNDDDDDEEEESDF